MGILSKPIFLQKITEAFFVLSFWANRETSLIETDNGKMLGTKLFPEFVETNHIES